MGVNTTPIRIELSKQERDELIARMRSQTMAHRDVLRATIVLLLADGQSVSAIARPSGLIPAGKSRSCAPRARGSEDDPSENTLTPREIR